MINREIIVLHYRNDGESSDKIWAIDVVARNGQYDVWYGRRNSRLRHDTVSIEPDYSVRMQEKVSKGYEVRHNLTVDVAACRIVPKTAGNTQLESEPEPEQEAGSWWFTLSSGVDSTSVDDFLDEAITQLKALDASEAAYLQGTKAYMAISAHERQGEIEFVEGPMPLLLIFGLQRTMASRHGRDILLADDGGELISELSEHLGSAIVAANGEYLQAGNSPKEHYATLKAIKQYAIALGCMDAPINLSAIKADTAAAFF